MPPAPQSTPKNELEVPPINSVLTAEMLLYRHHSGPLPPPEQLDSV